MRVATALCLASLLGVASGVAHVFTPEITLPKKKAAVVMAKELKQTHKKFLAHLESFLEVTYLPNDKRLTLKTYEEYHYDHLYILGNPTAKLGADLLDFVDHGRNIFVAASGAAAEAEEMLSEELRAVAVDCGVEVMSSKVRDNFAADPKVLRTSNMVRSRPILGDVKGEVAFSGVGLRYETDNPLVVPILRATRTAYATEPEGLGQAFGSNIALVAAIQTRIGSRGTFLGSVEMLGDAQWATNGAFAARVSKWAAQWYGVLRHGPITHYRLDDNKEIVVTNDMLRIGDWVRFAIDIEEFDGDQGKWVPFVTPKDDPVQVEYTMLDPYVRADLVQKGKTHTVDLRTPDQYGIFKFVVDYRRTGYNPLVIHHQCPLRPLKMNEYDRFIFAAYPYYLSAFSAMFGFLLFGFVFLHLRDETEKVKRD